MAPKKKALLKKPTAPKKAEPPASTKKEEVPTEPSPAPAPEPTATATDEGAKAGPEILCPEAAVVFSGDPEKAHLHNKFRYCCKKCRRPLFVTDEIVPHETGKGQTGHKKFKYQNYHVNTDGAACTSYFLDPDVSTWVSEESREAHATVENASAEEANDLEARKNAALIRVDYDEYLRLEGVAGNDAAADEDEDDDDELLDNDEMFDDDDDDDEIIDSDDDDDEIMTDDEDDKKKKNKKGASAAQKKAPAKKPKEVVRRGTGASFTVGGTTSVVAQAAETIVDPDTIYCPNQKCRAKIGAQCWTGSQCSCGAWVTPAFKIHHSKVDGYPLWI